jgi:PST family polysaccharide transporter
VISTEEEPQVDERPLGQVVTRALGWSSIGQVINRIGTFASGIILARLLTKEDFGVFAVALVAVNLLMTINDVGVIAAVVRWQGDIRVAARTGATVTFAFSVVLYAIVFFAAPPFSDALGAPAATNLLRVIALIVVVDGICGVSQALLMREFLQARLLVAETAGAVVYIGMAIALAVGGMGAWSIVWARLAGSAVTGAFMVALAPFRARPGLDRPVARELIGYGAPLAAAAVATQAVLNVDYVVVGHVLGAVALGGYLLAFNLSSWPTNIISSSVARVAFAGFTRLIGERDRLASAFPRAIGVALSAVVPLVLLLGVLAPEVIRFVYGPKWLPAVVALRFLLALGALRIVTDLMSDLIIADKHQNVNLLIRLAWFVALVPALLIGAETDGIRGVGIGHMVVVLALVTPLLVVAVAKCGIPLGALARNSVRPLVAALASLVAMAVPYQLTSGFTRLVVIGTIGSLAYAAVLLPRNPLVGWMLGHIRNRPTDTIDTGIEAGVVNGAMVDNVIG